MQKSNKQLLERGLAIEKTERPLSLQRQAATRKNSNVTIDTINSDNTYGQTRDIVASQLGISGRQWSKIKFIYNNRHYINTDDYETWLEGKVSTSHLYLKIKEIKDNTEIIERLEIQGYKIESERARLYNSMVQLWEEMLSHINNKYLKYFKVKYDAHIIEYTNRFNAIINGYDQKIDDWAKFLYDTAETLKDW